MRDYSTPRKMYVQVTTNCNERCLHCCHACGPERRDFMSLDTFRAAMRWEPQALLNFGGGEPTCHPLFWDMLDIAIKARGKGKLWIATNGKRRTHAILLAGMIRDGVIMGALSVDQWHEKVGQDVVDAFLQAKDYSRKPTIRNVGRTLDPIRAGRCDWGERRDCVGCGMPFVQTDGGVRQCACNEAPVVGDVFSGYEPMYSGKDAWTCAFGLPDPNRR